MAWDPLEYDIKRAIMDEAYQGKEVSFDDDDFVQKIKVNDDGTADVDWFASSNSEQNHWNFVFKLGSHRKIVPGSGKLCHR